MQKVEKKYKRWIEKYSIGINSDVFRNTFEEYLAHIQSRRVNTDIYFYKSFDQLKQDVDRANNEKSMSISGQQKEFDILIDNTDMYLVRPKSHESSRKLGLKYFAFREENGTKDCAWCTTFASNSNFNSYYFQNNVTFYYLLVRNTDLQIQTSCKAIAFAVYPDGKIEAYNELDQLIGDKSKNTDDLSVDDITNNSQITNVRKVLNIDKYLIPFNIDGRKDKYYQKLKNHLFKNPDFKQFIEDNLIISKLQEFKNNEHSNYRIFGKDINNATLFYNTKNHWLNVHYSKIWSIFGQKFNMDYSDIQLFITCYVSDPSNLTPVNTKLINVNVADIVSDPSNLTPVNTVGKQGGYLEPVSDPSNLTPVNTMSNRYIKEFFVN